MAPNKKKQAQTMSIADFMNDSSFGGSWADEVEDTIGTQPLPSTDRPGMGGGSSMFGGDRSFMRSSGPTPLPTRPPFTAHIGNLPYDATMEAVTEFFDGCGVQSVRIIEDREMQRPKGFAYVEFHELDGLKRALDLDNEQLNGRYVKVKVADPPRGGGDSMRDLSDWSRKGPLTDLPGRGGPGPERRAPREPMDDGRVRDFGNWERRGPLTPLAGEAPPMSREGSRARTSEMGDSMRNRHQSPAWGEGRQEGSRPPHREFRDKPERVVTAAERDNAWRSNMRPDARNATPSESREGSEAPSSPAAAPAAPAGRPKLNLAKRTVSNAGADAAPAAAPASDSKASPFGAARPIDTRARDRAIEERKQKEIKEKAEAEEKAKEERRLAKEAAAKAEAEAAEAKAAADAAAKEEAEKAAAAAPAEASAEAEPSAEGAKSEEAGEKPAEEGETKEQKLPTRPKEPREPKQAADPKSRASESGNWRRASTEHKAPRGAPSGPRRGGRGGRSDGPRPQRANGGAQQQPTSPTAAEPSTPVQDAEGWTTVPKGGRRQGRPVAS